MTRRKGMFEGELDLGTGVAWKPTEEGWEHRQVDIRIDTDRDAIVPISPLRPLPYRVFAVIVDGTVVDLMLIGCDNRKVGEESSGVDEGLASENRDDSPVCVRHWQIAERKIEVQAEVWVDERGIGFTDLFARPMREE